MTYDRERSRLRYEHRKAIKKKADERWRIMKGWLPRPDYYLFTREVRRHEEELRKYINSGYCKKSEAEKEALLREMLPGDAPFLAANNPKARIEFYNAWKCHVGAFEFMGHNHLITLAPRRYAMPFQEAKSFDIFKLMSWARNELRDFNSIGIVEIACYTNLAGQPVLGAANDPIIAFHVHVVVSNANAKILRATVNRINEQHEALIEGCPAAHMAFITPGTLQDVLRYLAKGPTGDYRVYPIMTEAFDPQTGEITEVPTGRFRQQSKKATKKLQLRIREITATHHLDKMIFATGAGVETLKAIRKDALRELPWSKRSGRQFKFSGTLPRAPLLTQNATSGWVNIGGYYKEEGDRLEKHAAWVHQRVSKLYGSILP